MRLRKQSLVPPRDLAMQHLDVSSRSSRIPQSTFTAEANTDVIFLHKERKVSAISAAQIEITLAARDVIMRDVLARMVGMVQEKIRDEGQERDAGYIDQSGRVCD